MINFRNTIFIKSAPSFLEAPDKKLPEILIVGRSNVGKSSLINSLCDNSSLAFTSSKPGFTKLLNYFSVDKKFYLVDAPGYGYSKSNIREIDFFGELMEKYLVESKNLHGIIFLLDSRRETNDDDKTIFRFLNQENIPFVLVLTKVDKINQSEKHKVLSHLQSEFGIDSNKIILTSSKSKNGVEILRKSIENLIR